MFKFLIVGQPNTGKSTLFNRITKSSEHTGNFHGVTVEGKSKTIKHKGESFEFVDLPGLYSLNAFSLEEEVSVKSILNENAKIILLCDACSLRKNFYLCQQLNEIGLDFTIFINNYENFSKKNNAIDIEKLKNKLNKEVFIINAKKFKLNEEILKTCLNLENKKLEKNYHYLEKYIKIIEKHYKIDKKTIIFALNGIFFNLNEEQIQFIKSFFEDVILDRYNYIDRLLEDCVVIQKDYVYGLHKVDKFLLNPFVAFALFALTFFVGFYTIFFLVGPLISALEERLLNFIIVEPLMNFLCLITDNIWILEFVKNGVLNSVLTVISFVPQVCLLFVFLGLLEDSGMISRFAYVFDDFLSYFGLNGKAIYVMLLGFGCNSMATVTTRNLGEENLRKKSAIINPYFSCMARLPVYFLIASAFFSKHSFLIVFGLYVLGIFVALCLSKILNKTILKTKDNELTLEFPPLRGIDPIHALRQARKNGKDFFVRVFSVVISVGVIVWILSHTQFNLTYTADITNSILFIVASKISPLFAPIGLNNAGIITALVVGVLAKELIVSTISICNNVGGQAALAASLTSCLSVINFTSASAISFLIFTLLYSPCASNLAVIKKEVGKFYMWFCIISQLTIAYMLSFVVYQALINGIVHTLISVAIICLVTMCLIICFNKIFSNKCKSCGKCRF